MASVLASTLESALDTYLSFPTLLVLVPFLFLIFKKLSKNVQNLPPGPKPWPIIGNLPQIGSMPHVALAQLAKSYGPLVSVRLGTQLVIVGSSPAAAAEILKTHDQKLSGRLVPHVSFARDPEMNKDSIAWTFECSERWKFFRTLMRNEIFSSKIVDGKSQAAIRERKVEEMIKFIASKEGKELHIREVVFVYTFNVLANIYLSQDFVKFEGGESKRISGLIREMMELYTALNVSDLYPLFGGLDLQGLFKKTNECVKNICEIWEDIIRSRRDNRVKNGGSGRPESRDFLDVLLDGGFSDEQISFIFVELLAAVSDSSSSTAEWALSELIKSPNSMKKLRQELSAIPITASGTINESDITNLPYLHACVKETLRLHPPAPLLLPHRATEDVQVMNYTVPKDSQVFVNVWAIARDPEIWEDPLCFKPERFLVSDLDYKGNNFEYLPFGSGRRICAGLPLAIRKVQLSLAALVLMFDWSLPGNMTTDELDMKERYGVTLMKEKPLVLIPYSRK